MLLDYTQNCTRVVFDGWWTNICKKVLKKIFAKLQPKYLQENTTKIFGKILPKRKTNIGDDWWGREGWVDLNWQRAKLHKHEPRDLFFFFTLRKNQFKNKHQPTHHHTLLCILSAWLISSLASSLSSLLFSYHHCCRKLIYPIN